MGDILIITGTGTEVGKTVAASAIAATAAQAGRSVAVVKLAQTGVSYDMAGDIDVVGRLVGAGSVIAPYLHLRELIRYDHPVAPATAARLSGREALTLAEAVGTVSKLAETNDTVIVEGAGGLNVRYSDDPVWTLADLASELQAPVLVVAAAGLGTLNHTSLTLEALALRGIRSAGVVIGAWPTKDGLAERTNLIDLAILTGEPVVGVLPEGMAGLEAKDFHAAARLALSPGLYGTFDAADFQATHDPKDYL